MSGCPEFGHLSKRLYINQHFDISPIDLISLQRIENSPGYDRVKGFFVVHKRETQRDYIPRSSVQPTTTKCVDVVFGTVAFLKPACSGVLAKWNIIRGYELYYPTQNNDNIFLF